ncbi:MAG: hypothetical protein ACK559_26130, partial [bacterium]
GDPPAHGGSGDRRQRAGGGVLAARPRLPRRPPGLKARAQRPQRGPPVGQGLDPGCVDEEHELIERADDVGEDEIRSGALALRIRDRP